eukprot:366431-Chlamydomonas_euryale.AAC.23
MDGEAVGVGQVCATSSDQPGGSMNELRIDDDAMRTDAGVLLSGLGVLLHVIMPTSPSRGQDRLQSYGTSRQCTVTAACAKGRRVCV